MEEHRPEEVPNWVAMDEPAAAPLRDDSASTGVPTAVRLGHEVLAWVKTLASAAVYATLIVTFGFQVARVDGRSMEPTLHDQDRLIVNKLAYRFADPQPGDIVMLLFPNNPKLSFVKRVVGLPGDTIEIRDGHVFRNGLPLPDDFIPESERSHETQAPRTVPDAHYFVLGDHRNNSSDSRDWGYVPRMYILGKVSLRWWPVDRAVTFAGFDGRE